MFFVRHREELSLSLASCKNLQDATVLGKGLSKMKELRHLSLDLSDCEASSAHAAAASSSCQAASQNASTRACSDFSRLLYRTMGSVWHSHQLSHKGAKGQPCARRRPRSTAGAEWALKAALRPEPLPGCGSMQRLNQTRGTSR